MARYASKIVEQAEQWIGCKESNGTHKKIIDVYNSHTPLARGYKLKYTDHWCAGFVSAVAIKVGYTDIIPTEVGCGRMITLCKAKGIWHENENYTPNPGDIIFYDWDDSGVGNNTGSPDHVGIVQKVVGKTIHVIEGNYGNAVAVRKITVNGKYIRGYALPKYEGGQNMKAENIKIVVDPGHGGDDNGAVKYITEDTTNLVQAKACVELLKKNGFNVKLTRSTDKYVSLADRVKIANDWKADLFISFHNNAAGGDGFEAYVMSEVGKAVGKAIEKRVKAFGQNSRGIKDGSKLYVVKNTNMPAVLLEGFFVDNKKDAAQNDTIAEQTQYGDAVAKGIMDYYGIKPKSTSTTKSETTSTTKKDNSYTVKVSKGNVKIIKDLPVVVRKCPVGSYTIVEEKNGYGKLKSGEGWILLSEVTKL